MGFLAGLPLIGSIGGAATSAGAAAGGAAGIATAGTAAAASGTSFGSALTSLVTGGAASLLGKAIMKSPSLPPPPQTPALSSMLTKSSLIGPYEGSANGTLVSGTNQRSGGKTLLGQ